MTETRAKYRYGAQPSGYETRRRPHFGRWPELPRDLPVHQCLNETYDLQAAKSYVFMHLYTNASQQANAIGLLIEKSYWAGWQLWRTLYEAYVVCEFLARFCSEHPQVFRDYISSTLLRSWIRQQESYNELCGRSGKEPHYAESVISHMKSTYKEKFGSGIRDYD